MKSCSLAECPRKSISLLCSYTLPQGSAPGHFQSQDAGSERPSCSNLIQPFLFQHAMKIFKWIYYFKILWIKHSTFLPWTLFGVFFFWWLLISCFLDCETPQSIGIFFNRQDTDLYITARCCPPLFFYCPFPSLPCLHIDPPISYCQTYPLSN